MGYHKADFSPETDALTKIAEYLEVQPIEGRDLGEDVLARITAIKTENNHLRERLELARDPGNQRSVQYGKHKPIVAASLSSRADDDKVLRDMLKDDSRVAI